METTTQLLRRVAFDDPSAWGELAERLRPDLLHQCRGICRQYGFSSADAEDIFSEFVANLPRSAQSFDRNRGAARAFLSRALQNAALSAFRKFARKIPRGRGGDESLVEEAAVAPAADELSRGAERQLALSHIDELLDQFLCQKQPPMLSRNAEIFILTVRKNNPVQTVAERFQMKPSAIYVAKGRIAALLRKELRELGFSTNDVL